MLYLQVDNLSFLNEHNGWSSLIDIKSLNFKLIISFNCCIFVNISYCLSISIQINIITNDIILYISYWYLRFSLDYVFRSWNIINTHFCKMTTKFSLNFLCQLKWDILQMKLQSGITITEGELSIATKITKSTYFLTQ